MCPAGQHGTAGATSGLFDVFSAPQSISSCLKENTYTLEGGFTAMSAETVNMIVTNRRRIGKVSSGYLPSPCIPSTSTSCSLSLEGICPVPTRFPLVQPVPLPHVLKSPPPAASMICTPSQSGGPCSLLIRLCPCPLIDDPPIPGFLSSPPDSGVRVSPPRSFARLSARPPRPRPTRPPSVSSDVTLTPGKARSPVPILLCLHY